MELAGAPARRARPATPPAPPAYGAPSAPLDRLKAQAASTHPGAPPPPLGGWPWPRQPASGRPKDGNLSLCSDSPLSP